MNDRKHIPIIRLFVFLSEILLVIVLLNCSGDDPDSSVDPDSSDDSDEIVDSSQIDPDANESGVVLDGGNRPEAGDGDIDTPDSGVDVRTSLGEMSYDSDRAVYTVGLQITDNRVSITGTGLTFTISPTLPDGLEIDPNTGTISGTPVEESAETEYEVTASNSDGQVKTTITIRVIYPAPGELSYVETDAEYQIGEEIEENPASVTGTGVTYSISPDLPDGITLDSATGTISGTPTEESGETEYLITASNSGGETTTTITVTVTRPAPTDLSYDESSVVYTVDQEITDNEATVEGSGLTFSVSPDLPSGLKLDLETGTISGTPTEESDETEYEITATNSGGDTDATITITVNYPAPSDLSYDTIRAFYTVDQSIDNNQADYEGEGVVFSVSPSLPDGLSLDDETGQISGTPTTEQSLDDYRITATNSGGSTFVDISIAVLAAAAAHWDFEDGSGVDVTDSTGNGYDGTIIGDEVLPFWIEGKVGDYALQLDGENNYVLVSYSETFNASIFTLSSWLYSENGTAPCAYFRRVGGWYMRTSNNEWDIILEGETVFVGQSGYAFPDDPSEWHHYAVVVDNIVRTITFYVDGVQFGDSLTYVEDAVFSDSTGNVYIGQFVEGFRWNGRIDDVRFFDYALSDDEILTLYQIGQD